MYDLYPDWREQAERQAPFNGGLGHASDYGVEQSLRPLSAQVAEQATHELQTKDAGSLVVDAAGVELQA